MIKKDIIKFLDKTLPNKDGDYTCDNAARSGIGKTWIDMTEVFRKSLLCRSIEDYPIVNNLTKKSINSAVEVAFMAGFYCGKIQFTKKK